MTIFSRVAVASLRSVRRLWPFQCGKDLAAYVGAVSTRIGLVGAEWYEFRPGLWMLLNMRDLVQQTILLEGAWDPDLSTFIETNLSPGDVFIDVGAHVGYFTLLAARRVGPRGTVLSIEPNPFALDQLRRNVERSHLRNVLMEHTACGESRATVPLYLQTESNSSMASLYFGKASSAGAVDVRCTPLDDLCQERGLHRVMLVKIDVEGAELFVLRGMKRIMREMRPAIVIELHPHLLEDVGTPLHEVLALLQELDYVLEPMGGHSNYLCRPRGNAV